MRYRVRLTEAAENDLLEIYNYIAEDDGLDRADGLLNQIEERCLSLETIPERGHIPPELERLEITEYFEVRWKPFRIIYWLTGKTVNIMAVLDGRRDLNDLLIKRLLA